MVKGSIIIDTIIDISDWMTMVKAWMKGICTYKEGRGPVLGPGPRTGPRHNIEHYRLRNLH